VSAAVSLTAPTMPAPPPVAACACGCTYAADEWLRLLRRPWLIADESLEIAECTSCQSTIAVPLEVVT
jgi:hypothetical protein